MKKAGRNEEGRAQRRRLGEKKKAGFLSKAGPIRS